MRGVRALRAHARRALELPAIRVVLVDVSIAIRNEDLEGYGGIVSLAEANPPERSRRVVAEALDAMSDAVRRGDVDDVLGLVA